jgi:DNA-directed RNA polymerase specialized sigma24 family protein
MKATQEEYAFHQRLLARDDPTAFAELAEWLYTSLVHSTCARAGATADPVLVEEAVGQALLDYHDAPERYDPDRSSLQSYLSMVAYRDFQNARAKEHRRLKHQVAIADTPFGDQEGGVDWDMETLLDHVQAAELWKAIQAAFPDPVERQIVELLSDRVRDPDPYAKL